jgi:hypothetical protein
MDTAALESAYKRLLDVARAGGFTPPGSGGEAADDAPSAERLLARVVVEDRLLAQTTAELLAGGEPSYTNESAQRPELLDELVRAYDGLDGLTAEARRGGLVLVRLARALDEQAAARAVPTRLVEEEAVRMDTPMPWSGVLNTYAEVELADRAARLEARQAGAGS